MEDNENTEMYFYDEGRTFSGLKSINYSSVLRAYRISWKTGFQKNTITIRPPQKLLGRLRQRGFHGKH